MNFLSLDPKLESSGTREQGITESRDSDKFDLFVQPVNTGTSRDNRANPAKLDLKTSLQVKKAPFGEVGGVKTHIRSHSALSNKLGSKSSYPGGQMIVNGTQVQMQPQNKDIYQLGSVPKTQSTMLSSKKQGRFAHRRSQASLRELRHPLRLNLQQVPVHHNKILLSDKRSKKLHMKEPSPLYRLDLSQKQTMPTKVPHRAQNFSQNTIDWHSNQLSLNLLTDTSGLQAEPMSSQAPMGTQQFLQQYLGTTVVDEQEEISNGSERLILNGAGSGDHILKGARGNNNNIRIDQIIQKSFDQLKIDQNQVSEGGKTNPEELILQSGTTSMDANQLRPRMNAEQQNSGMADDAETLPDTLIFLEPPVHQLNKEYHNNGSHQSSYMENGSFQNLNVPSSFYIKQVKVTKPQPRAQKTQQAKRTKFISNNQSSLPLDTLSQKLFGGGLVDYARYNSSANNQYQSGSSRMKKTPYELRCIYNKYLGSKKTPEDVELSQAHTKSNSLLMRPMTHGTNFRASSADFVNTSSLDTGRLQNLNTSLKSQCDTNLNASASASSNSQTITAANSRKVMNLKRYRLNKIEIEGLAKVQQSGQQNLLDQSEASSGTQKRKFSDVGLKSQSYSLQQSVQGKTPPLSQKRRISQQFPNQDLKNDVINSNDYMDYDGRRKIDDLPASLKPIRRRLMSKSWKHIKSLGRRSSGERSAQHPNRRLVQQKLSRLVWNKAQQNKSSGTSTPDTFGALKVITQSKAQMGSNSLNPDALENQTININVKAKNRNLSVATLSNQYLDKVSFFDPHEVGQKKTGGTFSAKYSQNEAKMKITGLKNGQQGPKLDAEELEACQASFSNLVDQIRENQEIVEHLHRKNPNISFNKMMKNWQHTVTNEAKTKKLVSDKLKRLNQNIKDFKHEITNQILVSKKEKEKALQNREKAQGSMQGMRDKFSDSVDEQDRTIDLMNLPFEAKDPLDMKTRDKMRAYFRNQIQNEKKEDGKVVLQSETVQKVRQAFMSQFAQKKRKSASTAEVAAVHVGLRNRPTKFDEKIENMVSKYEKLAFIDEITIELDDFYQKNRGKSLIVSEKQMEHHCHGESRCGATKKKEEKLDKRHPVEDTGNNYVKQNIETQKYQTSGYKEVKQSLFMKCEQLKKEIADEAVAKEDEEIDLVRQQQFEDRYQQKNENKIQEQANESQTEESAEPSSQLASFEEISLKQAQQNVEMDTLVPYTRLHTKRLPSTQNNLSALNLQRYQTKKQNDLPVIMEESDLTKDFSKIQQFPYQQAQTKILSGRKAKGRRLSEQTPIPEMASVCISRNDGKSDWILGSENDRDDELSTGLKQRMDLQKRQEALVQKDKFNESNEQSEQQYQWANSVSDATSAPNQREMEESCWSHIGAPLKSATKLSKQFTKMLTRQDTRVSQFMRAMVQPEQHIQVFTSPNEVQMKDLKIKRIKCLGSGAQGQIHVVKIEGLSGLFVEKTCEPIINNPKLAEEQTRSMLSEFFITKDLVHPNVNRYRYFMKRHDPKKKTTQLHILQDYHQGGDLSDYIKNKSPLSLQQLKDIAAQLISAIWYLHDRNIFHCDLKPENILMSGDWKQLMVTDLGFSRKIHMTMKTKKPGTDGTCQYMAPEQFNQFLSKKSDIWSFGCILIELATGKAPFHDLGFAAMSMKIISQESPLEYARQNLPPEQLQLLQAENGQDSELTALIKKCLTINRQHRPEARVILCDQFFEDVALPNFEQQRKELLLQGQPIQEKDTSQIQTSRGGSKQDKDQTNSHIFTSRDGEKEEKTPSQIFGTKSSQSRRKEGEASGSFTTGQEVDTSELCPSQQSVQQTGLFIIGQLSSDGEDDGQKKRALRPSYKIFGIPGQHFES